MQAPSPHIPAFFPSTLLTLVPESPQMRRCAEHHSIHEQSAQKQQHGTVSHCSCSVVVQFAVTGVNHFV